MQSGEPDTKTKSMYCLFPPRSDLLHCDFCSDAAQSAGDDLGYASYGQRLCVSGEAQAEGRLQGQTGQSQHR